MKWEYHTESVCCLDYQDSDCLVDIENGSILRSQAKVNARMSKLGRHGWELVTVQPRCQYTNYIYKRPMKEEPPKE